MASSSSSTSSPCAACKFLRRKCTQECVFSPYFPPDHPQKFACVHKVFGASNVAKLLNEIASQHREDAVNSLYYEAEARLRDPVYGCVGLISILQHRLKQLQHETEIARKDLATYIGPQALIPIYNCNPQQSSSPFIALQQPLETQNHQQQQFVGKGFIPTGQPLFTREQHQQQRQQNFQSQLQQHHELMFGYGHQNQNQVEILGFSNGFDTTLTQPQTQQTQERVTISALPSLALGTFDHNHSSSHHNYQTEQLHLQRREVAAFVPTQQQTLQTSETLQTQQQSSNNEENRRNVIGGQSLANFENK